jgi:hypothetical protein
LSGATSAANLQFYQLAAISCRNCKFKSRTGNY